MRSTPPLIAGLLATFALACADDPAAPPATPAGPAYGFVNNPDNGNPRIVRFETGMGFFLVDPGTDMFSVIASADVLGGCNQNPTFFSFVELQQVIDDPDDPMASRVRQIVLGNGLYIAVFEDFNGWAVSGFDCGELLDRLIGEGSGKVRATDNDLWAFLNQHANKNAFGFVAHGTVELAGGGTAGYHALSRCVGRPPEPAKCVDRIRLG